MTGATGQLRISIIGHTGSGKSTLAGYLEDFAAGRGLTHSRVKLAKPLYDLQAQVYRAAGVTLAAGAQDQVLMEHLAEAMRRIRPESLAEDFLARLATTDADVVINDDLRDPHVDAVALRGHGFRIIRVTVDPEVRDKRLAERGDLTRSERSTAQLDLIEPDVTIDNSGDLHDYRDTIRTVIGGWL
jgi:dephospho-CoA kinase